MSAPKLRCAIYTRKSSEEGLEQDFNSLHAQREACEAYVLSQIGEGWTALPEVYDDGGFSGGSLDRPGLRRLLADVTARRIDIVLVYKVDRLTRSLTDFAKIVETFDAAGASFVSVTQAFNTTTSMGRLTLNVLLSFAQFEREVTGERIRDKIAASKAKGIWMGGMVPLGYDLQDRRLVINEPEAKVVRQIFARYVELGSAKLLARELADQGVRTKSWTTRTGRVLGGCAMARGAIFHVLQNRLYLGEIVHNGQCHQGRHPPIVPADLFEAAAARLQANAVVRRGRPTKAAGAVLTGRIFDAEGHLMTPTFAYGRAGRHYRYYVSTPVQLGRGEGLSKDVIRRVGGSAVERFLATELQRLIGRPILDISELKTLVRRVDLRAAETQIVLDLTAAFRAEHPDLVLSAVKRRLGTGEQVVLERGDEAALRIVLNRRLQLRGGRTWIEGHDAPRSVRTDRALVAGLKGAHARLVENDASPLTPRERHRHASQPGNQHGRLLCRMAFMAPDLQRRILTGAHPAGLKMAAILNSRMPLAWADQRAWLEEISQQSRGEAI